MPVSQQRIWQTTQWGVWMLAISVFLNYVDRGALAIAMPQMRGELGLNAENLGRLASAFFWTYAALQIPAGWLVDRFDVKWVLGIGFAVWTVATGLTGFATGFASLLLLRLILGIGESVAYPAYSRVIATRFPPEQRGVPNALIDCFSKMGPALSTLIGGLLVAKFGWRFLFIGMGLGGLIWLLPWLIWESKERHDPLAEAAPKLIGFGAILARRECWGTMLGLFALNYAWYFLIFWFPPFLVMERGFSQERMAVMGSLPFWLLGASSMFTGWWSDKLIRSGRSATWIRKGFYCGGMFGVAGLLLFASAPNPVIALGVVMAAGVSMGFASSNNWAITQTLAGREAAGRWTGIQNGFGNLGGVVSPWLTGFVVDRTGSFFLAFAVTSGVVVVGTALYFALIPRVAPIKWVSAPSAEATGRAAD
ncbi:MAG: MFS transporter [Bryobacteraceae bacterium]|nr:MFS transporter [Bryobacteraceae bacterium]